MDEFFGTPWRDLTPDHVRAFLADQEDEGLTWETKGTEIRPAQVHRAVCGLTNQVGGFFIVGAGRERGEPWVVDGVSFHDEPRVWLSNVIGTGLDPQPMFDIHAWPLNENRHLAVVNVDPVPVPPCVTSGGQVYQRLPGKTELISDAAILASLFERGARAKEDAQATAIRARDQRDFDVPYNPYLLIYVACASAAKPEDVGRVLFGRRFEAELQRVAANLPNEPLFYLRMDRHFRLRHTQSAVYAEPVVGDLRQQWRIRCQWDGSVQVCLAVYPEGDDARLHGPTVMTDGVRPAADAAIGLLTALGGYGSTHITVRFETHGFRLGAPNELGWRDFPQTVAQTWTDGTLSDEALERWGREVLRAAGYLIHEPWDEDEA